DVKSKEKNLIDKELNVEYDETDELVRITSKLLSTITNQLACVTYPNLDSGILDKLQIVSLTSSRILVIVSIKSGLVKTITLELTSNIKESQIESVQSLLNERLAGLRFKEIRKTFKERLKDVDEKQKPIIRLFFDSMDKIFKDEINPDKLIVTGAKNVIRQPEFESTENFQSIVELMEDKDIIIHIMEKSSKQDNEQVFISIGSELAEQKMKQYSFISKEYKLGETSGTLGIIGPKRMEYSKIVAIVDYLAKMLSQFLTNPVK
ncbi:MAG: HrcA family transcriptional regulator, partial [Ignavibacteriaceae bacterium]